MSYDGIGLKSAKGSSTSGHIQQSLALNTERKNVKNFLSRVEKQQQRPKSSAQTKRKDESILKHLSKRELELRVSEYRDALEDDDSLSDATIDAKCQEFREKTALQLRKEHVDEKLRNAYVSRSKRQAESGAADQ